LASAAGTRAGGTVHVYDADPYYAGNQPQTIILTGAITDHGVLKNDTFVLSRGSIKVNTGAIGKGLAAIPTDPKTCAADGTVKGSVPIVTGTGAYRRIRGAFQTTVTAAYIDPRLKNGRCDLSATRYPGVLIAHGSGTVSYK
jgi:hypothetical protein